MVKLGSLFDGIAGFPLAAFLEGITPVWASEIEAFPIEVSRRHFPDMKHLGDVTKINGAEIEPVDLITFGSPCTRLSVAGRHDGFDITFTCEGPDDKPHEKHIHKIRATDKYQYLYMHTCPVCGTELIETNESALFFHAIRIIEEMRTATDGRYPTFAIWENVPGAFSSNNGRDFRAAVGALIGADVPMPLSGRWATAGMVRGNGRSLAWRVLDAQYWGVPQRRRRIFLIADFRGQRAPEILFEREGVSGDTAAGRGEGEGVAGGVAGGVTIPILEAGARTGASTTDPRAGIGIGEPGDPMFTLQAGKQYAVAFAQNQRDEVRLMDKAGALAAEPGMKQQSYVMTLAIRGRGDTCQIETREDGKANALLTPNGGRAGIGVGAVCVTGAKTHCLKAEGFDGSEDGTSRGQPIVAIGVDAFGADRKYAQSVTTKQGSRLDIETGTFVQVGYRVRRLTPLKCERLQGLPDGWTAGGSDTVRYKAIGNGIAIPPVRWIMNQIRRHLCATSS